MTPRKTLLLLAALLLASCGELLEPAAAVVHGEKISVHEIDVVVERLQASPQFDTEITGAQDPNLILRQYEQGYLSALIRREVLRNEAAERGIEISDEEVDTTLDQFIDSRFDSRHAFEEAMQEAGQTLELVRERIRDAEYEEELRDLVVEDAGPTEEELRAEYQARRSEYEQLRASHILFRQKDRVIAQGVADQLQAASKKELPGLFKTLTTQYSIDKISRSKGGDVGFFLPHEFDEDFVTAALRLNVGEVSDPVESRFGWHIIYLTDRELLPFEEARGDFEDEMIATAQDDAWEQWLMDAFVEADIKVNPRYGEFDLEEQVIVDPRSGDIPGTQDPPAQEPQQPQPQPAQPG